MLFLVRKTPALTGPPFLFVLVHVAVCFLKLDSAVSGRAQRASARNQNGAAPEPAPQSEVGGSSVSQPVSVASESYIMVPDDETSLSRSNSAPNLQEGSAAAAEPKPRGKGRPKGKGKAKETEVPVRVKEEPQAISLHTPEPLGNQVRLRPRHRIVPLNSVRHTD